MMHFHRWSNWQDVKLGDVSPGPSYVPGIIFVRPVITQQRRCSVCNRVDTRYSR